MSVAAVSGNICVLNQIPLITSTLLLSIWAKKKETDFFFNKRVLLFWFARNAHTYVYTYMDLFLQRNSKERNGGPRMNPRGLRHLSRSERVSGSKLNESHTPNRQDYEKISMAK